MSVLIEILCRTDQVFDLRLTSPKPLDAAKLEKLHQWIRASGSVAGPCTLEHDGSAVIIRGNFHGGYDAKIDTRFESNLRWGASEVFKGERIEVRNVATA